MASFAARWRTDPRHADASLQGATCAWRISSSSIVQDASFSARRQPSSELKVHLAVYAAKPEISAVVHAHPLYATALYRAGRLPQTALLMEAAESLGAVPLVPFIDHGTQALADAVGRAMTPGGARLCAGASRHGDVWALAGGGVFPDGIAGAVGENRNHPGDCEFLSTAAFFLRRGVIEYSWFVKKRGTTPMNHEKALQYYASVLDDDLTIGANHLLDDLPTTFTATDFLYFFGAERSFLVGCRR